MNFITRALGTQKKREKNGSSGVINHIGGIKQRKSMLILRDFPVIVHFLGLVNKNHQISQRQSMKWFGGPWWSNSPHMESCLGFFVWISVFTLYTSILPLLPYPKCNLNSYYSICSPSGRITPTCFSHVSRKLPAFDTRSSLSRCDLILRNRFKRIDRKGHSKRRSAAVRKIHRYIIWHDFWSCESFCKYSVVLKLDFFQKKTEDEQVVQWFFSHASVPSKSRWVSSKVPGLRWGRWVTASLQPGLGVVTPAPWHNAKLKHPMKQRWSCWRDLLDYIFFFSTIWSTCW